MSVSWNSTNRYMVGTYLDLKLDSNNNNKVCAFDLDHTIIKPKNDKRFPNNEDQNDWEFFDDSVVAKLTDFQKQDYKLVIVTNQKGLKTPGQKKDWMGKVENVMTKLKIPAIILCSLKDDLYRKPRTKLWEKFIKCDLSKSFYCGDAGGLKKRKIGKITLCADFDENDVKFAKNLGVTFIHRDNFIFAKEAPDNTFELSKISYKTGTYDAFIPDSPEIIIMVGYPGSGKSYYAKNYIISKYQDIYEYVNQDTLKTSEKCLKAVKQAVKKGKSVVVDNTNPGVTTRKKYLDVAKENNFKCRCIVFTTSQELSRHNNIYRNIVTDGKTDCIPDIAYRLFNKNYKEPTAVTEPFDKVEKLEFLLDKQTADLKYYDQYYF